jgi:hypothetical protein
MYGHRGGVARADTAPAENAPSSFITHLYFRYPLRIVFLRLRDHPLFDRTERGMGCKSKMRLADPAVTALGVVGFLGFLIAGRMDDANASPFDIFAFVWFFTFGGIKLSLPWLLKRAAAGPSTRCTEDGQP